MADIRIKDLATTATTTASDDFMAVDGTTNGTRKMNAAAPAFLTSVTTPSLTSPASTNLTLGTGTFGTALTVASATGNVSISSSTASGSAITGALQVQGGIGVAGSSFFGGAVSNVGAITLDSTQSLTRALIIGLLAQSGGNTPYVSIKPVSTFADFALGIENTNSTSGQGLGLRIVAGSTASDFPLYVRDRTNATTLFSVGGTGAATFAGAVTVGGALKLGNAYVAGAVVGTGSITIQDSTGTTYRIPVLV
jgi:hypothetical protein